VKFLPSSLEIAPRSASATHKIPLVELHAEAALHGSDPEFAGLADDERLACLVNENNGQTWGDCALRTTRYTDCYSIGGWREVIDEGYILGSVTDRATSSLDPKGVCPVYFFSVKAGRRG